MEMPHEAITRAIIGCAFEVSNELGAGFLESVYERALVIALQQKGLQALPQQAIKVLLEHHRGLTMALYLPFAQDTSGDIKFGSTLSMFVPPEINPWD